MSRPPSGRGRAVSSAPCATAMARTMASPSPSPCPSSRRCRTRSSPSRWNGWNRRSISPGGMTGPVLVTRTTARPAAVPVSISAQPPGLLCRMALPTRFATRLSASRGSPSAGAGLSLASIGTSLVTAAATTARSKGSGREMPRSLPASVSSASISFSCCRPSRRTSSQAARRASTLAAGSPSATCSTVRSAASGVRSSWAALATKCRCDSNEASSRANRSLRVWPSRLNSSSRPEVRNRRLRFVAEMSRAVATIACNGRSRRPASSQPNPSEAATAIASVMSATVTWGSRVRPGWLITGGAVDPTCAVSLTARNGIASTTSARTRNTPPYSSASRVRSEPENITRPRSGTRPRGWSQRPAGRRAWPAAAGWWTSPRW
jgi:hypothetical protein